VKERKTSRLNCTVMRVDSPPNKIEPLEENKAFSSIEEQKKRQSQLSQDEFSQSDNVAQPRLSFPCFPESIRLTFTSPKLEKIYQRSNKRERLKSNLFCALSAVVVNAVLLFIHALSELGSSSQRTSIIVISAVWIAIFTLLLVACFRQCSPGYNVTMFVWLFAALEACLILGFGEDPLTPNDLVGMFTFLAFLAFILLPTRLRFCIFWVTVLAVIHSIIVGVSSARMDQYSHNQVRYELYLCIGI
jgi:hypothetical protein